jgi:hypothetical protein
MPERQRDRETKGGRELMRSDRDREIEIESQRGSQRDRETHNN